MKKTSLFKTNKDMLIPESPTNKPLTDKDGNELSGDEILLSMQRFVEKYTNERKEALPRVDPIFVSWLNQYKKMRTDGKSADEILKLTISRSFV